MECLPRKVVRLTVVMILLVASAAMAGNTGKIAGTIKDKQTRQGIIGVNVLVKGTTLGAVTDENGYYFILRVPPGSFQVQVSMLGYRSVLVQNVNVQVDLTTEINAQLEPTEVQVGEVVIIAEQKLVQKDVTSTRRTITRENIRETPGLESTGDIFKLQAGAFLSSAPQIIKLADGSQLQVRDESLKDIHIRGGRGGEILYMVDGMPVNHPIYGGRSVLDLNVSDVENVELITGAFNAEYGQAQSGVVNISTRSGGDQYKGGVEYKTDKLEGLGEVYTTDYTSLYLGGPEPLTHELLPALGIDVPGALSFFLSGNLSQSNTPYDNGKTRKTFRVLGFNVTERQDNTTNLNAKVNWDVTAEHRLSLSYHGSNKQWSGYDWLWRYYPDHIASYNRNNDAGNIQYSHVISKSTYFNLNLGYLGVTYKGSLDGKTPPEFWVQDSSGRYVSTISSPTTDNSTGFYNAAGYENIWRNDNTKSFTFKGDFTSQVHSAHLLKTGIEVQTHNIRYVDIQDGGVTQSYYAIGQDSITPPGPFPLFGINRWVFHVKPYIGGAYLQDKFELEYLIINAGMRFDWFYLGKEIQNAKFQQRWEDMTGLTADWKTLLYKFSPRFGISFPISERMVVFFSYGHFNQLPELQYYYRDPFSGQTIGNPRLDYEQTILYEFGLTNQISDSYSIDVKSYAKDISKQVGTTTMTLAKLTRGAPPEMFDNKGYARARGLEFEVTKGYSDLTSGKMTYTVQWTSGYSSSAFDDYVRSQSDIPFPIRERALSWDVRHQVIFQGIISASDQQDLSLFDFSLPNNWSFTVLYRFSTGTPYTPGEATTDPAELQRRENTSTGPSTSSTDLKFEKGFLLGNGVKLAFTADVFNLFDQKNIQIEYGFNTWTGKPFRFGDIQKPQQNFYDYYTMLSIMDPRQFSTGRTTKLGIRIDF